MLSGRPHIPVIWVEELPLWGGLITMPQSKTISWHTNLHPASKYAFKVTRMGMEKLLLTFYAMFERPMGQLLQLPWCLVPVGRQNFPRCRLQKLVHEHDPCHLVYLDRRHRHRSRTRHPISICQPAVHSIFVLWFPRTLRRRRRKRKRHWASLIKGKKPFAIGGQPGQRHLHFLWPIGIILSAVLIT